MDLSYSSGVADDVAQAIGLDIVARYGHGADLVAYLLSDGRVMKLTEQVGEAAAALSMKAAYERGDWHTYMTSVTDVFWLGERGGDNAYVILREELRDFTPPGKSNEWANLLEDLEERLDEGSGLESLMHKADKLGLADRLGEAIQALRYAERECGVSIRDLCPENFGILASGSLGVRDWGETVDLPTWALDAAHGCEFDRVPDLLAHAPSRR